MTKNSKKFLSFLALAAAIFAAGTACQQRDNRAHYIDSDGNETIVSLEKVNIQDFAFAAEALANDMLKCEEFANSPKKPIVALSRVKNDTSNNFDTAMLTDKVQEILLKSGKATISMSMSIDRTGDDVAEDVAELEKTEKVVPDFTLIGTISDIKAMPGQTRQVSYAFKLRLVGA